MSADPDDPRLGAAFALLARTGAGVVTVRFVEPEADSEDWPVVWLARAEWDRPEMRGSRVAAGMGPLEAVEALCELVIDGGQCALCGRPAGLVLAGEGHERLLGVVCWWRYDPEADPPAYRPGCE